MFTSPPGFEAIGDLLKPTLPTHPAPPLPQVAIHPGGKLLANDLDSSLANLVGSECPPNLPVSAQTDETKDRKWMSPPPLLTFSLLPSLLRSAVRRHPSQEVSVILRSSGSFTNPPPCFSSCAIDGPLARGCY